MKGILFFGLCLLAFLNTGCGRLWADLSRILTLQDIGGLKVWFKADAITGLADGASVNSWVDSSGNGATATQGAALLQPTYRTNVINGLPVVRFDGTGDRMAGTTSAFSGIPGATGFLVIKCNDIATNQFVHSIPDAGLTQGFRAATLSGGLMAVIPVDGLSSAGTYDATSILGIFFLQVFVYDGTASTNSTRARAFANSVEKTLSFFGTIPTSLVPSSTLTISGRGDGTNPFNGDIAEIMLYNRALSDEERVTVEAYLNSKYHLF